jgi:hypothetical protein
MRKQKTIAVFFNATILCFPKETHPKIRKCFFFSESDFIRRPGAHKNKTSPDKKKTLEITSFPSPRINDE